MPDPSPSDWTTCPTCGDASPPQADVCPTCGAPRFRPDRTPRVLSPRRRRLHTALRATIVLAVALGIAYALVAAVVQGPPVVADPLTGSWTYTVGAGNFTYLAGAVTGEDYVLGNYSVSSPPGALVTFAVYNATEFQVYGRGLPAAALVGPYHVTSARIDFPAPYTDLFYFVWANPYAPTSGIALTIYANTVYTTNVVVA